MTINLRVLFAYLSLVCYVESLRDSWFLSFPNPRPHTSGIAMSGVKDIKPFPGFMGDILISMALDSRIELKQSPKV